MGRRASRTGPREPARDVSRAQRQVEAVRLRMRGLEWQAIADQLGIQGGKASAYKLVNSALKAERHHATEELRTMEVLRLDALLAVQFPKALDGDGWAFDRCLKLLEQRRALMGLDVSKTGDEAPPQVIVRAYAPEWIGAPVAAISEPA